MVPILMTRLTCTCGQTALTLSGPPIMVVDCCCTSCRTAAAQLPGGAKILGPHGETRFVLQRKDRVTLPPPEAMAEHRLTPGSKTRRVVATCCNTPLFLEFQGGHWLSLYGSLWPEAQRPAAEMRTMAADLPDPFTLPDDIPNSRRQSPRFMWNLLTAWAAMGFRAPRIAVAGKL
jgi:hypothetical protein